MSTNKLGKLLSVSEAADYLGMTAGEIYRLSRKGRIACVRSDGRVLERVLKGRVIRYRKSGRLRFYEADLDQWIEAHRTPATTSAIQPPAKGSVHRTVDARLQELMPAKRRFM